jgi:hypothetical protein
MATQWRLLALLLLFCVFWALLIGAAAALGRRLPPSNNHILMRDPACALPCLLDIIPGETRREDAINRLVADAQFPIDQTGFAFSFQIPDDQGHLMNGMLISDDFGRVQYTHLYTRRWDGLGVRLADVMPSQPPSDVYRSCSGTYPVRLMLTYEGDPRISITAIVRNRVSLVSPVSLIAVSADEDLFQQTLSTVFSAGCYIPSEWQGFGATWLYERPDVFFP